MKHKFLLAGCALLLACSLVKAQDIALPAPALDGKVSLTTALQERCSQRAFDTARPVELQQLANLLWAAWGYNREDKRTAPTALNRQDISLYVFTAQGAYRYDARRNLLVLVAAGDHRAATGKQPFVTTAPVNIVFVSDTKLLDNSTMSAVGCGAISQNIYLYCAAAGLATVVRGSFDAEAIAAVLNLDSTCRVMLAQTIGYPAQ